jgi:acetoin utilization protein AcuB
MRIGRLMSREVETARPDEPAEVAWRRLHTSRINHLVVLRNGRVVGVISSKDLSRAGAGLRHKRTVEELMTPGAVGASPTTSVQRAAELMQDRSIGCLPVLDNGTLVGMITVEDLQDWVAIHRDRTRLQAPEAWSRKRPGGLGPATRTTRGGGSYAARH